MSKEILPSRKMQELIPFQFARGISVNMPNASAKPLGVMSVHRLQQGESAAVEVGAIPGRKEAVACLCPL